MNNEKEGSPMPRICDVLAQLNDAGALTVRQLESKFDWAPRSGYPFLSYRELSAGQLRNLFQSPPPGANVVTVQQAIMAFMMEGTRWNAFYAEDPVKSDADFDTAKALDAAAAAFYSAADALNKARELAKGKARPQPEEITILATHLQLAMRTAHTAHKAIHLLAHLATPRTAAAIP